MDWDNWNKYHGDHADWTKIIPFDDFCRQAKITDRDEVTRLRAWLTACLIAHLRDFAKPDPESGRPTLELNDRMIVRYWAEHGPAKTWLDLTRDNPLERVLEYGHGDVSREFLRIFYDVWMEFDKPSEDESGRFTEEALGRVAREGSGELFYLLFDCSGMIDRSMCPGLFTFEEKRSYE